MLLDIVAVLLITVKSELKSWCDVPQVAIISLEPTQQIHHSIQLNFDRSHRVDTSGLLISPS